MATTLSTHRGSRQPRRSVTVGARVDFARARLRGGAPGMAPDDQVGQLMGWAATIRAEELTVAGLACCWTGPSD